MDGEPRRMLLLAPQVPFAIKFTSPQSEGDFFVEIFGPKAGEAQVQTALKLSQEDQATITVRGFLQGGLESFWGANFVSGIVEGGLIFFVLKFVGCSFCLFEGHMVFMSIAAKHK